MKYRYLAPLAVVVIALIGVVMVKFVLPGSSHQASVILDYSGKIDKENTIGVYHGEAVTVPHELLTETYGDHPVLGVASPNERWIEVDLSEQKLRAWEGNSMYLETLVSTGLPWWRTPTGEFRIWIKLRAAKMEGGSGRLYYNLPNVPYIMYFGNNKVPNWRGYGLHGTYWHNDFGRPHSHGCVNLPTPMAEKLYYWTGPVMPEGKSVAYASAENPGTRIVIHD
jgi:lipoprotein-anchoring transpeptidase ErfK/SrfK